MESKQAYQGSIIQTCIQNADINFGELHINYLERFHSIYETHVIYVLNYSLGII